MQNNTDNQPIGTLLAIEANSLVRKFGEVTAVDKLSCAITQGEIVALLGINGAGKTTFIDLLLGLQQPSSGSSSLFGMDAREAIRRSLVGVVNQTGALPTDYTVEGTINLFSALHLNPLPLEQTLSSTNLEGLRKRRVGKLSGGEQQRLRLALAILPDPLLLILDEPTTGMDATARREFWTVMEKQSHQGRTIVFATHYLAEAEDFAARTIIMKDGAIIADGPTIDIRQRGSGHLSINLSTASRGPLRALLEATPSHKNWTITWLDTSVEITGANLDDAARILLNHPGTHGLKVSDSSLEEVFTTMMRQEA